MKDELGALIREKKRMCFKGYRVWRRVLKQTKTNYRNKDNTKFVLLSSHVDEYNYFGLLYLHSYLMAERKSRAVILGIDKVAIDSAKLFSPLIAETCFLDKKDVDCILELYALYRFEKNLIVVDLDRPNGRNASSLIGKRGITIEDIISIGVYSLFPVRRPAGPKYNGDNNKVKLFLDASKYSSYIPDFK